MGVHPKQIYEFGPFRLDPNEHQLLRDGHIIPLTPKAFETLFFLVQNSGHLLEKDELLRRLWPDTIVEEVNLARNIFTLRKVLDDEEEGQRYIETVPKVGYRFVAAVKEIENADSAPKPVRGASFGSSPETSDSQAQSWRTPQYSLHWIMAIGLVSVLLIFGYLVLRRPASPPAIGSGRKMLAVLPFQNLSGDPSQEYFVDGLTVEMITQLGQMEPERLGVIARTSAMQYKSSAKTVDQIGHELSVDYVLEGSVRRESNRVRISAQLIQVRDQTHLWAHSYERDSGDVISIESDVAGAIAHQVEIKLAASWQHGGARGRAPGAQAHEIYLKARYEWNKRTEDGLKKGAEYFRQAIALEPDYADAYAGLADSYALLSFYGGSSARESFPLSKSAALKAIELDENSAEGHASLGFIYLWYQWDWLNASREYRRALEIDPGYATARQYYAEYLRMMGHQEEALAEGRKALELDPLSPVIQMQLAMPYYYSGRYDEAIRQLQKLLEMEPHFAAARGHLGWVYEQAGRYDDAIREYEATRKQEEFTWALGGLGRAYAKNGNTAKAREIVKYMENKFGSSANYGIALIYAALGEQGQAMRWLERAYQDHYWGLVSLKVEPKWNEMRSDPRFQDLLRRIGFVM